MTETPAESISENDRHTPYYRTIQLTTIIHDGHHATSICNIATRNVKTKQIYVNAHNKQSPASEVTSSRIKFLIQTSHSSLERSNRTTRRK